MTSEVRRFATSQRSKVCLIQDVASAGCRDSTEQIASERGTPPTTVLSHATMKRAVSTFKNAVHIAPQVYLIAALGASTIDLVQDGVISYLEAVAKEIGAFIRFLDDVAF